MKRKGNLFNDLCDFVNIIEADINARKGKARSRIFIEKHDENLIEEDKALASAFMESTYKTSKYDMFTIYEPKKRLIYRLPYYPDRIAHHAIMLVTKELWTKLFIPNTYSCIEGRGIHKCLNDLRKDLRKTRKSDTTKYCLKLDIKKFYPSINHVILKAILAKKIKDKRLLNLLSEIIDSVNGINGVYGIGVPIGNYLSQFFANLYLTYFDYWCKQELKCRYYYRYADDIVILSNNKRYLHNILCAIKIYLKEELYLKVKDNFQIFPVECGIDFVGYIFRHNYVLVRKRIKNSCFRKLTNCKTPAERERCWASYYGWFKHCKAKHLIKIITKQFNLMAKAKRKTGRAKPMVGKAGVTRSKTAYKCGGKIKK